MRNFLFAASIAQQKKLHNFGVVVMSPERTAGKLLKQIENSKTPSSNRNFTIKSGFLANEKLIGHLRQAQIESASKLADFLSSRITALVP